MTIAKALVVDDSKVAHLTLRKMLMERSIEVDWVGSGEESIDYLKHQTPDVVFMDIMMPGMDGFETLQTINKDPAITKPRVVMCSANATSEDRSLADQHGAVAFLTKPYTTQELHRLLESLSTATAADETPTEPVSGFHDDSLEPTEQIRISELASEPAPPAAEPEPLSLELPAEEEPLPDPAAKPEPFTPTTPSAPAGDLPNRAALEALMREIAESVTRKNAEITLHASRQASTRVAESVAHRVVEEMLQHQSDQGAASAVDVDRLQQTLSQQLQTEMTQQIESAVSSTVREEINKALASEDFGQRLDQRIESIALKASEGQSRDIAQRVVRDMLADQQIDDTADRALGRSGSALTVGGLALILALAALALAGGSWLGML